MAAGIAAAALIATATPAQAQWQNKSTMEFSEPVMVPGHTLQPGTYVFDLMEVKPTLHTIRIMNEDESKTIAIVQAVPQKRMDMEQGASELKFRNTPAGSAPALKAWYYPGTRYGHEFIYPEDEARKLASQSKSLVLAEKLGEDQATSTLVMLNAEGSGEPYTSNEEITREWEAWAREHGKKDSKEMKDDTHETDRSGR